MIISQRGTLIIESYSIYTKEVAQQAQATNDNNTFISCSNYTTTSSIPTPSTMASLSVGTTGGSLSTVTQLISAAAIPTSGSNANSEDHTGAIIGGAVGGGLGLLAIILGTLLVRQVKHNHSISRGQYDSDLSRGHNAAEPSIPAATPLMADVSRTAITPYTATATNGPAGPLSPSRLDPKGFRSSGSGERHTIPASDSVSIMSSMRSPASSRHDDAGPLARSSSGILPPAYRSSWEPE